MKTSPSAGVTFIALVASLGLLVALTIAGIAVRQPEGPAAASIQGQESPGTTPVPSDLQFRLARRFRPILRFDSSEPWRPLNIEAFLREVSDKDGYHDFCEQRNPNSCATVTGLPDFLAAMGRSPDLGAGSYLDITGHRENGVDYRSPGLVTCPAPAPDDCNSGEASAIYYNVTRAAGRYYVDYWWFLRFNDFTQFSVCRLHTNRLCSDHEGDWEGVTAVTAAGSRTRLEYVGMAAHEGVFRYAKDQLTLADHDRRAVIYVARGSHASYPKPCKGQHCRQLLKIGPFRRPEGRFDGEAPWGNNRNGVCQLGASCLLPFPELGADPLASWNSFAGRWGKICEPLSRRCPFNAGPLSPGAQARFRRPSCYGAGKAETCDAPTPGAPPAAKPGRPTDNDCRAWLGELVAVLACDPASVAGALRPRPTERGNAFRIAVNGQLTSKTPTPGVEQVVRSPLVPGDEVVVSGRAPATTELVVRASGGGQFVEARFDDLGLARGGRAVVTIRSRAGVPELRLVRPDGRTLEPSEVLEKRLD